MSRSIHRVKARVFDLFCSIGGLTYGLQQAGLQVKAGLDIDGSCRYAYEANCGAEFLERDIADTRYADIAPYFEDAKCRILVGCAPCQPFSSLTYKEKAGERGAKWAMLDEFRRLILEGLPEIVSMENVPQLRVEPMYAEFRQALEAADYRVTDDILPCAQFGVPQRRRRLVMMAALRVPITLPAPFFLVPPRTVRDTIAHLAPIAHGQTFEGDPLHVCSRLNPINLQRIRASVPGGSWRTWPSSLLPECYKKASGLSYGSVYGRMEWDALAPTMTTQFYRYGTGRFGHPEQDRALSLREGALLQTFPEHYRFIEPGKKISFRKLGQHIGNAVPPALATAIGDTILTHVERNSENYA